MRFLIIDDELFARTTLKRLLSSSDVEIFECSNAYDGYVKTEELHPDIVFCDICMNGIGGDWMVEKILQNMPSTNVIVVSGKPKEELLKYKLIGAKAVITKPIKFNTLWNEIDAIMGGK